MILDRDKNYVNMKTDEARRAKIKADLDRLNYAKGNGLLETAKKPLIQNEIYLLSVPAERDTRLCSALKS